MLQRLYPRAITLLGGISLGLALTYLVGVFLAFLPGWEAWAEFFVPLAIPLLIPPYLMLVSHLILRNHVGRFLLNRQAYAEAVAYSKGRLESSLLRSRREVANQRIVYAKGLIALGNYEEAQKLLKGQHERLPGAYAMEARRWQLEIALRLDDRDAAEKLVVDDPSDHKSSRGELAAVLAAEAELALRNGELERFRERMMAAIWEKSTHPRTGLCRALAVVEHESDDSGGEEALKLLELVEGSIATEIPTRRAELRALQAIVTWRRGEREEARRLLAEAKDGPADLWTEQVIEKAAKIVD